MFPGSFSKENPFDNNGGKENNRLGSSMDSMDMPEMRYPQVKKIHYQVFNLSDVNEREFVEEIMTECAKGKMWYLSESNHFTRDDQYLVALKWAEYEIKEVKEDAESS